MTTIRTRRAALFSSAMMILVGAPAVAAAQVAAGASSGEGTELTEIIVTATKTGATALQKTPLAVSVFTGEALAQSATSNIGDLAQLSPSLNVGAVTASPSIYIRGIGTNNVFNGSDPDVTMQVDGVYLARPFAQLTDFFDVERIEVLRGPQGTIYGRNAVGGVVNIISRRPSNTLTGRAQLSVGDYDAYHGQAYVSGPIIGGVLNASLALNHQEHDPYDKNIAPGEAGVGDADRSGARLQLLWTPTGAVEATTRIDYNRSDENMESYDHLLAPLFFNPPLANSTIGDYHKVALDSPGFKETESWGVAEDINFTLNDNLSLRSLSAYRRSSYDLGLDFDASEFPAAIILQSETSKQFSQEFNLTGKYERFDFVAGLYYLTERQSTFNQAIAFVPGNQVYFVTAPHLEASSKAAFAQGTFRLGSGLSLTLGGRYTEDKKDLQQSFTSYEFGGAVLGPPDFVFNADISRTFNAFTPKIGLDWQAAENVLLYATYTEGWKSGGTNYAASDLEGISFDPETIKSVELGAKTQWFDNRVRLNATLFQYKYDDLQVQQALRQGVVVINNAASADVLGAEVEFTAQPTSRLEVSASGTYLDATYDEFPGSGVPEALADYLVGDPNYDPTVGEAGGYNAAGKRLNNAPKFSYVLAARYTHPLPQGELYGAVNYRWQSRTHFDPSNAEIVSEPSYGLLSLSVGYNSPDDLWNVQLLAKNVTDEKYFLTRAANALVPSALSGPPRTFTLSVARKF